MDDIITNQEFENKTKVEQEFGTSVPLDDFKSECTEEVNNDSIKVKRESTDSSKDSDTYEDTEQDVKVSIKDEVEILDNGDYSDERSSSAGNAELSKDITTERAQAPAPLPQAPAPPPQAPAPLPQAAATPPQTPAPPPPAYKIPNICPTTTVQTRVSVPYEKQRVMAAVRRVMADKERVIKEIELWHEAVVKERREHEAKMVIIRNTGKKIRDEYLAAIRKCRDLKICSQEEYNKDKAEFFRLYREALPMPTPSVGARWGRRRHERRHWPY